ncbi:hypothetical protein [Oleisolibacter albus]|uniref:hypothetical protein n=1 Tax=Oleisolibacter albus TaxID=2171757 RepID=UPI000DF28D04|nr:hypothetical protein [Oleisolibacter albus]
MRRLILAAITATLLVPAAFAADQPAAGQTAGQTATEMAIKTEGDARAAARTFLMQEGIRGASITKVRKQDNAYQVEVRTMEGMPLTPLIVEADGSVRRKAKG